MIGQPALSPSSPQLHLKNSTSQGHPSSKLCYLALDAGGFGMSKIEDQVAFLMLK
jgi:hypothetical protein